MRSLPAMYHTLQDATQEIHHLPIRKLLSAFALPALTLALAALPAQQAQATPPDHPNILQRPALSAKFIAFGYAGDLWIVPREGGRATRLTAGVGIEQAPVFSPDGQTLAFTGQYDGNTDVFTIPVTGGIPKRITFHPDPDYAVGWTRDGKNILFRSTRTAASRYTQLFTVPATGGQATPLPLPMAYAGDYSPDGSRIAYTPLPPAFGFDFTAYTAWGNYRGGRAGVIRITTLPGLESTLVPHQEASDFSPVYIGSDIFFLSGRNGHIGVFRYTPGSKDVTEILHNTSTDIHSLSTDGHTLIYDQLGELYTLDPKPGAKPHQVPVDVTADLPEVRPHLQNVAAEIENFSLSPEAIRIAVETHGEILTVPAKHGPVRNLTNTPGIMEREPAWSPDGQSIAFFSDEPTSPDAHPGLYSLHIVSQTGAGPAKKFPLAPEPAYYFSPKFSPDSKHIVFHDNRLHLWILDATTGKLAQVGEPNVFGGFSSSTSDTAWSPDSKWLVYPHSLPNHLHALFLYSVDTGKSTQLTDEMADAHTPAFDRNGKFLYFLASNNQGATEAGLDMSSDVYQPTQSIYALTLTAKTASPVAPETYDEKSPAEAKAKAAEKEDKTPAGEKEEAKEETEKHPSKPEPATPPKPTEIDLSGMPLEAIARRITPLPLPARFYTDLQTGKPGTIYFTESEATGRFLGAERGGTLSRWLLEGRKTEKLAEHIRQFVVNADGDKMLLVLAPEAENPEAANPSGRRPAPRMVIVPANAPPKPGDGAVSLADVEVHVDPKAEWAQMYHEVWNIERAFFYDAHFHGANTQELEQKYQPYVASIASRADLNYIFQEMLSAFSVGHLRGSGGAIPAAPRVPGGLLGADYVIRNSHYCLAKIYTGGSWSPDLKAPLSQPGLDIAVNDCILAINNEPLTAETDIQQPLEGTAGKAITLHIAGPNNERPRDITVIPIASEAALRNTDWIDANQRKVAELSGGKLAYVYLPDTAAGGFTNFNRYFFAQTNRQGVIVDERFNGGGQIADYIIEVLKRRLESFWAPRYGAIEHTPNDAIYGPKVMIANEFSGSGGDAMPWLFKYNHLGTLVGKRTWGGLVGIGSIPVLMDGGAVTSPSVAFFSPEGKWDVENHGVDPDVDIDQDPKAVAEGHDPQLEKSVSIALEQLAQHPVPQPQKPAYPHYSY